MHQLCGYALPCLSLRWLCRMRGLLRLLCGGRAPSAAFECPRMLRSPGSQCHFLSDGAARYGSPSLFWYAACDDCLSDAPSACDHTDSGRAGLCAGSPRAACYLSEASDSPRRAPCRDSAESCGKCVERSTQRHQGQMQQTSLLLAGLPPSCARLCNSVRSCWQPRSCRAQLRSGGKEQRHSRQPFDAADSSVRRA